MSASLAEVQPPNTVALALHSVTVFRTLNLPTGCGGAKNEQLIMRVSQV